METLTIALFLSVVVRSFLDYIAEPIRTKFPTLDLWWFNYLAIVVGGVVGWLANINLFAGYFDNVLLGRVLTALLVGGGAKLINDAFATPPALPMITTKAGERAVDAETLETFYERPIGW